MVGVETKEFAVEREWLGERVLPGGTRGAKETFYPLEKGVAIGIAADGLPRRVECGVFLVVMVAKTGKNAEGGFEIVEKR